MQEAQGDVQAVRLGDGRVLAVGLSRGGQTVAELWDPATSAWRTTEPPNKKRTDFALVPLIDGRALMTGGQDADGRSFSSAYVFDSVTEHWSKVGLMHDARTNPVAAVLADGRVLVAGGRYATGWNDYGHAAGNVLAGFHDARDREVGLEGPVHADADPGPAGRAIATAELFDPQSGTWSKTGAMHYPRVEAQDLFGAAAVTLGDGRVLVFGGDVIGEEEGSAVIELYDPARGRFSAGPALPQVDPTTIDELGISQTYVPENQNDGVALVPLADGDALVVGTRSRGFPAEVTRNVRFDAKRDAWVDVGKPFVREYDDQGNVLRTFGDDHPGGFAAMLGDGRVLVAGGWSRPGLAELLDPHRGTWSTLAEMPVGRDVAEAVKLDDGSVLVIGGHRVGEGMEPMRYLNDALQLVPDR